ncbi:ROK family glucokinase [Bacillus sp. V3B]|uniref:ROK family glucokinase n=1 Tax=Bacillus sp. V3B TaxID=2804915 RepID=UPI002108F67A|nr:ROK family glucokinase [Bacillus sp. V3B]MCQ6273703.1 ROK family glucokinase [Bacillus sp. V3B]
MSGKWLIGVDIGGTTTKMALLNDNGEIIEKWEIPTDNENEGKNITVNIAKSIEQKFKKYKITKSHVKGLGVGAPGPANLNTGMIEHTPNLSWYDYYPLRELLEQHTGLLVEINNDANCAALGEMWKGAGNGASDLVCVTLGTGVGGGVITNGKNVQGIRGAAGEIGHITSIPDGGARCNCGKSGCLETIASATGIVRLATERVKKEPDGRSNRLSLLYKEKGKITAKDVFDLARDGEKIAVEVTVEVSFYLGFALANIANTLNPDKIVLGGGVSKAGEILLNPLSVHFKKFSFPNIANSTELVLAKLGNDAGVIGAAWMIKSNEYMNNKETER